MKNNADKKDKKRTANKSFPGFWDGFASIFGMRKQTEPKRSDWESMRGDWEAVGNDLYASMKKYSMQ